MKIQELRKKGLAKKIVSWCQKEKKQNKKVRNKNSRMTRGKALEG
jgi:hypothetical protein